mgnify:CR=1 FL=1
MSLIETDWLEKNLINVKIIDCSWHMPQTKRNGFEEYKNQHIPNSIFFDKPNEIFAASLEIFLVTNYLYRYLPQSILYLLPSSIISIYINVSIFA